MPPPNTHIHTNNPLYHLHMHASTLRTMWLECFWNWFHVSFILNKRFMISLTITNWKWKFHFIFEIQYICIEWYSHQIGVHHGPSLVQLWLPRHTSNPLSTCWRSNLWTFLLLRGVFKVYFIMMFWKVVEGLPHDSWCFNELIINLMLDHWFS